jgi:hypothetical protein
MVSFAQGATSAASLSPPQYQKIVIQGMKSSLADPLTTGNAAFAVCSNLCRASFIGRTAKKLSAVRRTKRTAKNLCRASYLLTHGNAWQRFFAVRFNFGHTAKIFFPSSTFAINGR